MSFYVGVTNKKTLIVKINDVVIFFEHELKNLANLKPLINPRFCLLIVFNPDFPLGASSMLNLCKRTLFGAFCPSSLGIARYSRLNRNKNPTKIVSFPSNFLMEILG